MTTIDLTQELFLRKIGAPEKELSLFGLVIHENKDWYHPRIAPIILEIDSLVRPYADDFSTMPDDLDTKIFSLTASMVAAVLRNQDEFEHVSVLAAQRALAACTWTAVQQQDYEALENCRSLLHEIGLSIDEILSRFDLN
ncbi:MAG: hypothetical protein QXI19_03540 [Candidatus Caldarchaeum sp.]